MSTISHREMRNHSAEVLRRVEAGEDLVVTNRGRPVARLSPISASGLEELVAKGMARAAREDASWQDLPPALPTRSTSADLLADLRGDHRSY